MFSRMKKWITNGDSPPPLPTVTPTWKIQGTSLMNKNACSQIDSLYTGETATFVAESNCLVQVLVALNGENDGSIVLDIAGLKTQVGLVAENSLLIAHQGNGLLLLAGEAIEVKSKCQGTVVVRFAALDVPEGRISL